MWGWGKMRIGFSNKRIEDRKEHISRWWDEEFENDVIEAEDYGVLEGFYNEDEFY